MFLLGSRLTFMSARLQNVCLHVHWMDSCQIHRAEVYRLQWRKALSQSVSLKHLRGSHSKCWNHLIAPSSRVLGEERNA